MTPTSLSPLQAEYPIAGPIRITHSTTFAMLFALLAKAFGAMGGTVFYSGITVAILALLYGFGAAVVLYNGSSRERLLLAPVLLLSLLAFGFYFQSFYEEAVVLTFSPLLIEGYRRLRQQGSPALFVACASLVVYAKVQMIFVVPAFIALTIAAIGWRRALLPTSIIVCVGVLSFSSVHDQTSIPNAYNRYFNGIGWSLLQSHSFPGDTFWHKHAYFYENRSTLESSLRGRRHADLLGTSFWPTGDELMHGRAELKSSGDGRVTPFAEIMGSASAPGYVEAFVAEPRLAIAFLSNIYATLVTSDSSLAYLRDLKTPSRLETVPVASDIRKFFLTYGAVAFLLACAVALAIGDGGARTAAILFLGVPVLVVVGDGYYEFEKHMAPYYMLIPFVLGAAITRGSAPTKRDLSES